MEDKKYYTPSIEEFHVGFEFELYEEDGIGNHSWWSQYFEGIIAGKSQGTYKFTFDRLVELIKDEDVRVKYLDKEDIESLGWTIIGAENKPIIARKNFIYEYSEPEGNKSTSDGYWEIIYTRDNYCLISKECYGKSTFFSGAINNKSELKKLMKQLGINE